MAYTILVERAVERDGYSLEAALTEYAEFAAGARVDTSDGDSPAPARGEAAVAQQNEASFQEVTKLMAGMSFRSG